MSVQERAEGTRTGNANPSSEPIGSSKPARTRRRTSGPGFTIITGLSGAGRSEAARCLEDLGFFVVDNLPPSLLSKMAELASRPGGPGRKKALLKRFGSLARLSRASVDEIAATPGVGRGVAQAVHERLTTAASANGQRRQSG